MPGDVTLRELRKFPVSHFLFVLVFMGCFGAAYHFSKHADFKPSKSGNSSISEDGEDHDDGGMYCIFGAVAGSGHFLLFLIYATIAKQFSGTKADKEKSVQTLGTYRFLNFFFLLYCFGGSIGTGILGICSNMAECRYTKYQTENLAMAISISALHVLSLIHSVYTHLKSIDTEKTIQSSLKKSAPKKTESPKKTKSPKKAQATKKIEDLKTETPKKTETPQKTETPKKTQTPKKAETPTKTEPTKKTEPPKNTEPTKKTLATKKTEQKYATETSSKKIAAIAAITESLVPVGTPKHGTVQVAMAGPTSQTSTNSSESVLVDVECLPMVQVEQTRTGTSQNNVLPAEAWDHNSKGNVVDYLSVLPPAPPSYEVAVSYGHPNGSVEPVVLDQTSHPTGWIPDSSV